MSEPIKKGDTVKWKDPGFNGPERTGTVKHIHGITAEVEVNNPPRKDGKPRASPKSTLYPYLVRLTKV